MKLRGTNLVIDEPKGVLHLLWHAVYLFDSEDVYYECTGGLVETVVLHLAKRWFGWMSYHTRDQSSHQSFCLWLGLGLGNKSIMVKVGERSWFWLNVNKQVVSEVTVNFLCIKPDHTLSLTFTKML